MATIKDTCPECGPVKYHVIAATVVDDTDSHGDRRLSYRFYCPGPEHKNQVINSVIKPTNERMAEALVQWGARLEVIDDSSANTSENKMLVPNQLSELAVLRDICERAFSGEDSLGQPPVRHYSNS
jgi:hypothetical protein